MAARGRKRQLTSKTPPGPKPAMPDWIVDYSAVAIWRDYSETIHSLGLLESLDAISFGLLCDGIAALMDMRATFARDGSYTNGVGENGAVQVNPLCQLIAQQTKGVLCLAAEFGMTPRGRVALTGSLSCNPDPGAINPMEQLLREVTSTPAKTPQAETAAAADVATRKRATKNKPAKNKPPQRKKSLGPDGAKLRTPAKRKPKRK